MIGTIIRDVFSYEKLPLDIQKIIAIMITTGNQYLTVGRIFKYSTLEAQKMLHPTLLSVSISEKVGKSTGHDVLCPVEYEGKIL